MIHTVTIRNLSAGARYGYRITGDERLFNFSMPVESRSSASEDDLFPFLFVLTADLGQTAVSEANMFNLLDLAQSAGAGRAVAPCRRPVVRRWLLASLGLVRTTDGATCVGHSCPGRWGRP